MKEDDLTIVKKIYQFHSSLEINMSTGLHEVFIEWMISSISNLTSEYWVSNFAKWNKCFIDYYFQNKE